MFNNSSSQMSAISLAELGISMTVLIDMKCIESVWQDFSCKPDHVWFDGKGKKFMHLALKEKLQAQDKLFEASPELANQSNPDWLNFCDDCVILFILDAYLYDKPLVFLHPDSYSEAVNSARINETGGVMPDLIADIPVLQ